MYVWFMQTLKTKALTWHHFFKPAAPDIEELRKNFSFHPLVLDELTKPTMRPKVDNYGDYLYLVLHFPIFDEKKRRTRAVECDFILTGQVLITASFEPLSPLDDLFRKCSTERTCEELYASRTPAHLFCAVVKELYAFALRELDHIERNINRIDSKVLSGRREEQLIEELSFVRRDIIDFRRSVKPQQATLESLLVQGAELYGPAIKPFLEGLVGEYMKVWNLMENHKEAVDALYDNNATVLTIKQNEAVRILSIMAFITFPLMLFAAIFSMNTKFTPILGSDYDFWVIIGIMIVATLLMFAFFKSKKWL